MLFSPAEANRLPSLRTATDTTVPPCFILRINWPSSRFHWRMVPSPLPERTCSGLRPSSGAATLETEEPLGLAAPEDGRTPLRRDAGIAASEVTGPSCPLI